MLHPIICPQCFQPNEPGRALCWKCMRSLTIKPAEADFIRLFELKPQWKPDDLKAAFRRLARKYHPDMNPGNREADSHFKFVNLAYEALSRQPAQASPKEGDPAQPSAPPPKRAIDKGEEELYEKLLDVVEWSRAQEDAAKRKPPTRFQKLTRWLRSLFQS